MYDFISIGDTSHNVFLEMAPENAHLYCEHKEDICQLCFNYADKIPVKSMHDTLGGNSANAAVAFGRLGLKTAFYTHIGDDEQGPRIRAELQKSHVSTDYVVEDKGLGTNYSTVINLKAERTILIYHLHRHYHLPHMEAAKWMYLSAMGEGSEAIFPQVAEFVRRHGTKLSYQPGTFQLNYGAKRSKELLECTEIFFVNKEEAELYMGMPHGTSMRELLDAALALGPKMVVITDGPKGAYASDGKDYTFLGIIKDAPRIEATGAGDAFSSSFSAAIALGEDMGEALRWGQCQSSSVIQQVGGQAGLLSRKELAHLLTKYATLQPVRLDELE